eukprot:1410439-Amphidinium_carterae.1
MLFVLLTYCGGGVRLRSPPGIDGSQVPSTSRLSSLQVLSELLRMILPDGVLVPSTRPLLFTLSFPRPLHLQSSKHI